VVERLDYDLTIRPTCEASSAAMPTSVISGTQHHREQGQACDVSDNIRRAPETLERSDLGHSFGVHLQPLSGIPPTVATGRFMISALAGPTLSVRDGRDDRHELSLSRTV